jgi:hypothetical protein
MPIITYNLYSIYLIYIYIHLKMTSLKFIHLFFLIVIISYVHNSFLGLEENDISSSLPTIDEESKCEQIIGKYQYWPSNLVIGKHGKNNIYYAILENQLEDGLVFYTGKCGHNKITLKGPISKYGMEKSIEIDLTESDMQKIEVRITHDEAISFGPLQRIN